MTGPGRRRRTVADRPPGEIVSPIDWALMGHELLTRNGQASRLKVEPLAPRYRAALRWRIRRLFPIVATPTYESLWTSSDPDRRQAMLDAVFESGDFHYGTRDKELRQTMARWLHHRLEGTTIEKPSPALEQGALL